MASPDAIDEPLAHPLGLHRGAITPTLVRVDRFRRSAVRGILLERAFQTSFSFSMAVGTISHVRSYSSMSLARAVTLWV